MSAALGIAIALALLTVLSSPSLLGSVSNAPAFGTGNVPSAMSQSNQSTPPYVVNSTQTPATMVESSTAAQTAVSTATMVTTVKTLMTLSSSSVSSATENSSTVTFESLTTVVVSTVTLPSTQSSPTTSGVPPEVTYGSDHTMLSRASLFLVVVSEMRTLLILTSASAVVALGAMLFVRRRELSSEDEPHESTLE